jgi:hypothetical protein
VHPDIIEHDMNRRDVRGNRSIGVLQKGDEFPLPFPLSGGGVDRACARIKAGNRFRAPLRVYSCSTRTGWPGCAATVGALRVRGWRLVFSSTHSTISQTPKGRVYKATISSTWAANAASRGTRGDSHR